MTKYKFIALFLTFCMIFALSAASQSALAAPEIAVDAPTALLIEPQSGLVLYEKNAGEHVFPASITKITTTLIAIEAIEAGELSLDDVVTASDTFNFDMEIDGSNQNIQPGEQMTVRDLLYCILVASANDACNIIAEKISGDIQTFVQRMNDLAAELGCTDTHYTNTHGLHNNDHYTTARDIAIIFKEAYSHRLFEEIIATTDYTTAQTNLSPSRQLTSTDMLISHKLDDAYYYEYCKGGKTGSTSKAGYCFVSMSEKDHVELLCVVMGAEQEQLTEDLVGAKSFSQSRALYEWAYSNFSRREVVDTADIIAEVPVLGGEDADYVVLHTDQALTAFLDNDIDVNAIARVIKLDSDADLTAPIERGQKVGTVEFQYGGTSLGKLSLVTLSAVAGKSGFVVQDSPAPEASGGNSAQTRSRFTWLKVLIIIVIVLMLGYIALLVNYTIKRRRYLQRKAAAKRIRKD